MRAEVLPSAAMTLALAAFVAVALAALWWSARSALTIAVLRVENGVVRRVHGGLAPSVFADVADVLARPPVSRARVRILRDAGVARLEIRGAITPEQVQRLRNVIGNVPLVRLARARPRR